MKTTTTLKTAAILLTMTINSSFAAASWYQTTCTDVNGYTKTKSGHSEFLTQVSRVEWSNENGIKITPVDITNDDYNLEILEERDLVNESNGGSCDPESKVGYYYGRSVTFQKVTITKTDGKLFHEKVSGVSEDRKSVTAELLCENEVSNQIFCGDE